MSRLCYDVPSTWGNEGKGRSPMPTVSKRAESLSATQIERRRPGVHLKLPEEHPTAASDSSCQRSLGYSRDHDVF